MATKSALESSQFMMLPEQAREDIMRDITANGIKNPSLNMRVGNTAVAGPVFKDDTASFPGTVGPLTKTQVVDIVQPEAPAGALSAVAAPQQRQMPDIAEMLQKFVPQDDSQSRYLALAAGFAAPTRTGSFAEQIGNVASALNEQKMQQAKLRSQYAPLIMQQVAAQQAREEQNIYRLEAQRVQQEAQRQLAMQNNLADAQRNRDNQAAIAARAKEHNALLATLGGARNDTAIATREAANKPPAGYAWGPIGADGIPTQVKIPGGPADDKRQKAADADAAVLNGSINSFDRLATEANKLLKHPGLEGITGWRGAIPNIPGTDAADAQALLETLKSQVGFGVLQDMRNNSKTGGALGNVSDAEGKRLESNLASLEKAQSLKQFKDSLTQILDYTAGAKDRVREAYNRRYGESKPVDAAGTPPVQDDPLGLRNK